MKAMSIARGEPQPADAAVAGQVLSGTSAATPRRASERQKRWVLGTLSVCTVVGIYTLISNLPDSNHVLVPPTQTVFDTLYTTISNGTMITAIGSSLERVLFGYVIGAGLAVIVGSAVGWFKTVEYLADPLIEAVRPIPPLAYIPLVIIWLGIGQISRIIVIAIASFLVCVVSVASGMKQVPRVYVEAAQTLGVSRVRIFLTVAIPSALPFIFTGLRIALAAAWTTLVAAELIAAQNGLGYLLESGQQFFRTDEVMATIFVIGVLAFAMDRLARSAQRHFMRWSEAYA